MKTTLIDRFGKKLFTKRAEVQAWVLKLAGVGMSWRKIVVGGFAVAGVLWDDRWTLEEIADKTGARIVKVAKIQDRLYVHI